MLKNQKAFTLIELMTTVAIAAVVLGVAVPSFNTSILNNRSVALGEDLSSALNLARSEAVKRNARVSVCASTNGTACTGNVWTSGFIAFVDTAASDTTPVPTVGTILKTWPNQDGRTVITSSTGVIRYTGLGTLARISTIPITIDAYLTHCTSNAPRRLTIGFSGAIDLERRPCP